MSRALTWLWHCAVVRPLSYLAFGVNAHHRERLPADGPAIIVANHNSHLDVLLISALMPLRLCGRLRPVAARDYIGRRRWIEWFALHVLRAIPLERYDHRPSAGDPLAGCCAALARGEILILFPEGTRGAPERLGRLRPGIAHLAERFPEEPIVPVFLKGAGWALPKGAWLPVPRVSDIRIGRRLRWAGDRAAFMAALGRRFEELARQPA